MEKIVFVGKGGIGKSMVSANMSAIWGDSGRRVLHVGCDPKSDSSLVLVGGDDMPTFMDRSRDGAGPPAIERFLVKGKFGVDCIEAGGPEPGVGCAGLGISQVIAGLGDLLTPERDRYDVVVFDVLGDVVCGGFAAPLRKGFGEKVYIVVSDELMSLYAANNICKAVNTNASNGVVLGGLIPNALSDGKRLRTVERFARLLNTRVLPHIPRDAVVGRAEYQRKTLLEMAPQSALVEQMKRLAMLLISDRTSQALRPTPLDRSGFLAMSAKDFSGRAPAAVQEEGAAVSAANAAGLGFLSKILGLTKPWRLAAACSYADERIKIWLESGSGSQMIVVLRPSGVGGAFIRTRYLGLSLAGSKVVSPAEDAMLRALAARLNALPLGRLRGVLEKHGRPPLNQDVPKDKGQGSPPEPAPAPGQESALGAEPPSTGAGTAVFGGGSGESGGSPRSEWDRFIWSKRGDDGVDMPGGPTAVVFYGDRDCEFDGLTDGRFGFFRYAAPKEQESAADTRTMRQRWFATVDESDVVFGGAKKLDEVLGAIADQEWAPELVAVFMKCTPEVTGDDVAKSVSDFQKRRDIPVVVTTYEHPATDILRQCFARIHRTAKAHRAAPRKKSVNLIGFPSGAARAELVALLNDSGVGVADCLLPHWDVRALARLPQVELQILGPNSNGVSIFEQQCREAGIRCAAPAAPFGAAGTQRWLGEVSSQLEAGRGWKLRWKDHWRQHQPRWQTMRRAAADCGLGFVIDQSSDLGEPESFGNVPVLAMALELGFKTTLLVRASPSLANRQDLARSLAACLGGEARADEIPIRWFSNPSELMHLLSDRSTQAFYSDIQHDHRLLRHGKNSFSKFDFEMGLLGAIRTGERLTRLCRLPLYRDHAKYWGKTVLEG